MNKYIIFGGIALLLVVLTLMFLNAPEKEPEPEADGGIITPAASAAKNILATQLSIALDEIDVEEVKVMQWSDVCLGLSRPEELCAQVITRGFQVTLNVSGKTYRFRTNEEGTEVRLEA